MGYGKGKGIAKSAMPYRRRAPAWLKTKPEEVIDQITKMAKKGVLPSQIGVSLRDSFGVPKVKAVTGNKILRIKKGVQMHKHMEKNKKDKDSKFRLVLVESRIHRLARYYRRTKQLPANWKYSAGSASALVA